MRGDGHSKCFGFVCFSTVEDAEEAQYWMDGKVLGSKPLYVRFNKSLQNRSQSVDHRRMLQTNNGRTTQLKTKPFNKPLMLPLPPLRFSTRLPYY